MEAVIADALLTSRTPVKAALEQLRAQSRVAKHEGRGYVVLDGAGRRPRAMVRIDREAFATLASTEGLGGRRPAAWSQIYHEVERQVAGGALFGDLRIVEVDLAKAFGFSRTVARDVLSRLEKDGLVVKDERGSWRVLPLTPERTAHIYELRRALEPLALKRAMANGLPWDPTGMRDRLHEAQARLPHVDASEICAFERELHIDLVASCGNPEIAKALKVGHLQITANSHLFQSLAGLFPRILQEHLAIVDRMAANDADGAAEALEAHLDEAKASSIDRVVRLSGAPAPALPRYLQRDRTEAASPPRRAEREADA